MNRKQRRGMPSQEKQKHTIQFPGGAYTITEAGELAAKEWGLGNFQAALDIYDRILLKHPDYAEVYNNRAVILQNMKRYEEALASCDKAIALKPGYAEPHNNRGNTLQDVKRHIEAIMSYDAAIALKPVFPEVHNNRGNALQELKRYEEALASYDKAITLNPGYAEAHNNRGAALQKIKRYDDAIASFRRAIALKPDYAEAWHNLGSVLTNKGDMPEAEHMFQKALALRPGFVNPLFSLAHIRKYHDMAHADIHAVRALLARPDVLPADREQLYFALGKMYDDCGGYEEAFACFRQANRIRGRRVSYDPEVVMEITRSITRDFNEKFLAQSFVHGSDSSSPVFIVGMPRSGTTLMASILSNHPSVDTAGELPTMTEMVLALPQWLGKGGMSPQDITPAIVARIIDTYEKRLKRDASPDTTFVIDKHPLNFRHLGLISLLFPKARIIHCTRDPLDTCLSNYFQCFTTDYNYAFDLEDIGHFYGEYAKVMDHWRKVLPANITEISYEDMVMNTEQAARKALAALGLAWDERCLAPHTNPCAVETASHWQVRQPVYKESLGRWRHYEKYLEPLKGLAG